MDITIATCRNLPEPDHDEQPLLDALAAVGVEARMAAWEDDAVDWGLAPLTVVRSTWNYAQHRDEFIAWMRRVAADATTLRNPLSAMLPNTHKGYLATLERAGVPVVPTRWFTRAADGNGASIDHIRSLPWDRIICKPAIGAGSSGVAAFDLTTDDDLAAAADHVALLQQAGDVLVQPRLRSIEQEGERDIIWIDGEFTHVVIKSTRLAGDDEHVSTPRAPSDAERQLAERALRTIPEYERRELLYARVDVAADELGTLRVVELELVEPSLFLWLHDAAMQRFVTALVRESGAAVRR